MSVVTAKQLKRETGLSVPTIRAALDRAGVQPDAAGAFDRDTALAAIEAEVDPARTVGHGSRGLGGVAAPEIGSYASTRARSEAARAEKLELENMIRRGEYVARDAVIAAGADIVARVRSALTTIGARIAPRVAGLSDPVEIAATINAEVRLVLGELGDQDRFIDEVLS